MITRKHHTSTLLIALASAVLYFASPVSAVKICLDAGHGGSDPGAVGYGLEEAAVNLDICLRARSLFQQDGWTIIMTRTTDVYVSLQGRCDYANNNGADRFLCSHCNAFNGAAYGTETFCYGSGSSYSYDFRNKINPEMVSHMGTYNRGVKTANFYVLVNTNMPAILCEVAFIDNAGDAAKLGSASYRQEAARAYLHGTQSHYGISPHDPSPPTPAWDATYNAQSYPSSMTAGSTTIAWAEFKNTGTSTWAHCETKLGTSSPYDRSSPFCTSTNWKCADGSNPSCGRPSDVDQSSVPQNSIGRFTFILTAPSTPGTYTEKFKLLREGVTWFGPEITWTITVTASNGTLTGTVRNASNSQPIVGATVSASGVGTTVTNGSGVYTFVNVAAGTYSMSLSATGYNPTSGSATVTAGQTTTKDYNMTPSDTQAPTTPTNLTANATSSTTVQLSWTASTDNIGVTGYDIRRGGSIIGSSTGTSYTDSGATPDSTLTYDVRAKDAIPNYSGWSATATAYTPPSPPVATVVFSDGFSGNLNNWTQQVGAFAYSTTQNHGTYTGGGAAYVAATETDQMYRAFTRPFAQCKGWGYFYDGKGGWKQGVCGNAYRQALSLRDMNNEAKVYIDNCFYSASNNTNYFYRLVGNGGLAYTAYATRNTGTDCSGAWIYFETTVTPGSPGASPTGTFTVKVTDGAGTTTSTQNLTTDYSSYGIGRITLGLGASSANEGYWDDIAFQATPPDWPVIGAPSGVTASSIQWNFTPRDNNLFGWDVADGNGTLLSASYPAAGWLNRSATSWTESGLAANTSYTRKVRAWNGTLNGAYSLTASATTLSVAPTAGSVTPSAGSVCLGENVVWTAVGGFGAGKVAYYRYAWNQNAGYVFTGSETVWSSGTIATQPTAEGTWYLHVRGYNSADTANGTYSYALTPKAATAISQQPAAQMICEGTTAQFSLVAGGDGTLSYQWKVNGANITDDLYHTGATTPILTITNVSTGDAGSYQCVVTGGCGAATSSSATLTVRDATAFTLQPENQDVSLGANAQFSVAAVGDGAVSYQWQKNGVNLTDGGHVSGATTTTLTITGVDGSDAGHYHCVVTAGCGSLNSDTAALTISGPLCNTPKMDTNGDLHVDAADFDTFSACYNGPTNPASGDCLCLDDNGDQYVDAADFDVFSACYNGPTNPPGC